MRIYGRREEVGTLKMRERGIEREIKAGRREDRGWEAGTRTKGD